MFGQTFRAADAMDSLHSKAIDVMGQNNPLIRAQLERVHRYVDRTRQNLTRDAVREATGEARGGGALGRRVRRRRSPLGR